MKITRRGFALISTLLFLGILFMMSVSMIMMSRHRVFSGLTQHHKTQALYLAEAGLAKAQVALEADLDWPGEPKGTVDGIPGTYEIHFGLDRNGSVNNIGSDELADSYRGEDTVPKNTALLVVTANVSGQTYVLEALVEGKGSVGFMSDAILSSGNVTSKGNLDVNGVAALDDAKPVDGSIQSNEKTGSNNVVWEGNPGDKAHVSGNVGVGGATSGIKMAGAIIDGSLEANAPANIPHTDVAAEVSKNTGHPAPTLVPTGTTTVGSGKHSLPATKLDGDIVLADDAELYVNGDLEINGSISGKGTIYVNGSTTFRGDSTVSTSPDFSVALYSKGDVSLKGFDGTAYLQALGAGAQLSKINTQLSTLDAALTALPVSGAPYGKSNPELDDYWIAMEALGVHPSAPGSAFLTLKGLIEAGPASTDDLSATRKFLAKKVEGLNGQFSSASVLDPMDPDADTNSLAMADFNSSGGITGVMDVYGQYLQYGGKDPSNPKKKKYVDLDGLGVKPEQLSGVIQNLVDQTNYDKLGSSYFVGAIYTQGRFVAENEVTIVGALMADGDGGNNTDVVLSDGKTVKMKNGDIYLGNRTSVTYVESFFKDKDIDYVGPQLLAKQIWMGR